jgi:hypothetical protein
MDNLELNIYPKKSFKKKRLNKKKPRRKNTAKRSRVNRSYKRKTPIKYPLKKPSVIKDSTGEKGGLSLLGIHVPGTRHCRDAKENECGTPNTKYSNCRWFPALTNDKCRNKNYKHSTLRNMFGMNINEDPTVRFEGEEKEFGENTPVGMWRSSKAYDERISNEPQSYMIPSSNRLYDLPTPLQMSNDPDSEEVRENPVESLQEITKKIDMEKETKQKFREQERRERINAEEAGLSTNIGVEEFKDDLNSFKGEELERMFISVFKGILGHNISPQTVTESDLDFLRKNKKDYNVYEWESWLKDRLFQEDERQRKDNETRREDAGWM